MSRRDGSDVAIIILMILRQIFNSARQNGELAANVENHAKHKGIGCRICTHYQDHGDRLISAKAQIGGHVLDLEERIGLIR